jgi:hypothetical protein
MLRWRLWLVPLLGVRVRSTHDFRASGERLSHFCAPARCPVILLLIPLSKSHIAVPVARVETYRQPQCLSRRMSGRCAKSFERT